MTVGVSLEKVRFLRIHSVLMCTEMKTCISLDVSHPNPQSKCYSMCLIQLPNICMAEDFVLCSYIEGEICEEMKETSINLLD